MLRRWDLLVYVLCVCVGQRSTYARTTTAVTTLATTEGSSVCTVTKDQTACNSVTEPTTSDGSSSPGCSNLGRWILEINATSSTTVNFSPTDGHQPVFVLNTTENGVSTFQYSVSCCYDVEPADDSDATTCNLDVISTNENTGTPASSISFPEDTFAHVAIGCGGGIVVMLCLVFALGAICNKDQKNQAKYKAAAAKEAGNQQRKVEQPRPPSQDTPRRPTLDAVFDTGQRPGSHPGYSDRALPDPPSGPHGGYTDRAVADPRSPSQGDRSDRAMADPRERPYGHDRPPYDDPRGDYDDGYDNGSFQPDDYERSRHHHSQFAAPPREHHPRQQQMRRHTEAPYSGLSRYDNHGEAARNFNDPYDSYDRYDRREGERHGRYSEMPQYDRGMRTGPPADFDIVTMPASLQL